MIGNLALLTDINFFSLNFFIKYDHDLSILVIFFVSSAGLFCYFLECGFEFNIAIEKKEKNYYLHCA
jgi:hypothetical protein